MSERLFRTGQSRRTVRSVSADLLMDDIKHGVWKCCKDAVANIAAQVTQHEG